MLLGGVEKILDNGTRIRGYLLLTAFTRAYIPFVIPIHFCDKDPRCNVHIRWKDKCFVAAFRLHSNM